MPEDNRILFFAAVHGDEGFSIPILKGLEHNFHGQFSWLIANEAALRSGRRFIDTDLNRSAPGDPLSLHYEMRRAYELLKIAKDYRFVIDIHGTTAESGIFVIISNPTPSSIALAASLPITHVVVWAGKRRLSGSLTQYVDCGIGIECGPKDSLAVQDDLRCTLATFLTTGVTPDPLRWQRWFRVYGKILVEMEVEKELNDFQETTIGGENFYPLLVGQYKDVVCYKMQEVDFRDILAY